jgi:lipopolysaccharide transport system ATP-binding protein
MSDTVIKVEGLSKLYRIGFRQSDYRTLRDTIAQSFQTSFSLIRNLSSYILHSPSAFSNRPSSILHHPSAVENGTIWALKDVSFEIKRGEVVGIIGRNGAGKSTLLKILSRITEPTEGYAEIHGRVGSLLEVGTGFHPELTGRENIYLNGAILGMRKTEIELKFDEIVAFAEVEKFIDTPVKHYSSGMYVRLAFAVAGHLEPEILLVDEVLAVGDAQFQKKCLGKMRDVAKEGRTVIFVSHQMGAVKSLCSRAIQIRSGELVEDGEPETIIYHYLSDGSIGISPEQIWKTPEASPGDSQVKLQAIRVSNESGEIKTVYRSSQPIIIEIEFELFYEHNALFIGFDLINQSGVIVLRSCHNHRNGADCPKTTRGLNRFQCIIPAGMLNNGVYFVAPRIGLNFIKWIVFNEAEVGFEVQMDHYPSRFWNASHVMAFPGVIAPCLSWHRVDA